MKWFLNQRIGITCWIMLQESGGERRISWVTFYSGEWQALNAGPKIQFFFNSLWNVKVPNIMKSCPSPPISLLKVSGFIKIFKWMQQLDLGRGTGFWPIMQHSFEFCWSQLPLWQARFSEGIDRKDNVIWLFPWQLTCFMEYIHHTQSWTIWFLSPWWKHFKNEV